MLVLAIHQRLADGLLDAGIAQLALADGLLRKQLENAASFAGLDDGEFVSMFGDN